MTARSPFRPVLIVLATAVLAISLGACGRKGPLDRPSSAQAASTTEKDAPEERREMVPGSIFDSSKPEVEPEPDEPKGKKKKFILDPLLGDK